MDWIWKIKKPMGKEWLLISVGVSLLVLFFVYFFIHLPMQVRMEQAQAESQEMRQELQSIEAYRKAHATEPSYEKDLLERQGRQSLAGPFRTRRIFRKASAAGVSAQNQINAGGAESGGSARWFTGYASGGEVSQ